MATQSATDEALHIVLADDEKSFTFGPTTLEKYEGHYGNFLLDDVASGPHLLDIVSFGQWYNDMSISYQQFGKPLATCFVDSMDLRK